MKIFKIWMCVSAVLLALVMLYAVTTGLMKNTSVYIAAYTLSDGGTEMTVRTGIGSSMGIVRRVKVVSREGGTVKLDCFCGFGGLNGAVGAKDTYVIPLEASDTAIALCRDGNRYETVLVKDDAGAWHRPGQ